MDPDMKPCPFCAEPIRAAAVVCRFCNRPLEVAPSPEGAVQITPSLAPRAAFTRKRRALLAAVIILAMVTVTWFYGRARTNEPNPYADELARKFATMPLPGEEKQWHEVSHKVMSQVIDLRGFYGWLANGAASPKVKVILFPRCAASEADHVRFVVMNGENFERMRSGYPPIVLVSNSIQESKEVEAPNGKYWFGFVETSSTPPTSLSAIPTNAAGLVLYVISEFQKQNRLPIRLSAEITSIIKVYGTDSESAQATEELKQRDDTQRNY